MNEDTADDGTWARLAKAVTEALREPAPTHGTGRALRSLAGEIELHRTHLESVAQLPDGRVRNRPSKVQIGGGRRLLDGFYNIDVVPPADLLWDVREGIPLHSRSVDLLFSEHFLEHIDYPRSAKYYAAESYRVLAEGGRVVTGVPDAEFVLRGYPDFAALGRELVDRWYSKRNCLADINTYLDVVNYVFRDQDDDPVYHPHHWAYDLEKLRQLFTEAGFRSVRPWAFDPDLANPDRAWGSVYVVAEK